MRQYLGGGHGNPYRVSLRSPSASACYISPVSSILAVFLIRSGPSVQLSSHCQSHCPRGVILAQTVTVRRCIYISVCARNKCPWWMFSPKHRSTSPAFALNHHIDAYITARRLRVSNSASRLHQRPEAGSHTISLRSLPGILPGGFTALSQRSPSKSNSCQSRASKPTSRTVHVRIAQENNH